MKFGVLIETKEPEKAWNGFRFGCSALEKGHDVKVFLMSEAVECELIEHDVFNVRQQMERFENLGGVLLACGTCLKSRQLEEDSVCPISTMLDCVEMVEWADKIITF